VPVSIAGAGVKNGAPQRLFHASVSGIGVPFDVSTDGRRLLVNLADEEGVTPLNVMVNWSSELKKE
jgi:hypothetical protein